MLELYHNDMSVCAQKVRFTLAEKGLAWTGHHLNLRAGDQQKPEYLRLNPAAVVPTLVHDGAVILESTVIDEYLDDAYPDPPLKPADALGRARMRLWTKQLDEGVHHATGTMSYCIAFRHQFTVKPQAEIDAYIASIPDPARRVRIGEAITRGTDATIFRDAVLRWHRLLADFDTALREGPWLAGAAFSLADIGYAPYITRLDQLGFQAWYGALGPRIAGWYDRLRARPAYAEGIGKWVNPAAAALLKEKGGEAWPKVQAIVGAER